MKSNPARYTLSVLSKDFSNDILTSDTLNVSWGNRLNQWTRFSITLRNRRDSMGGSFYRKNLQAYDVLRLVVNDETQFIGVIDRIAPRLTFSPQGKAQSSVIITGQCISSLLTFDNILLEASYYGQLPQGTIKVNGKDESYQDAVEDFKDIVDKSALNLKKGVGDWFEFYMQHAFLLRQTLGGIASYQNSKGNLAVAADDFFDYSTVLTLPSTWSWFQPMASYDYGSVYDMLRKAGEPDFYEVFFEAKGSKVFLVCRPIPFLIDDNWSNGNHSVHGGWDGITDFIDGEDFHTLSDEISDFNIGDSHQQVKTVFKVAPNFSVNVPLADIKFYSPFIDGERATRFGMRPRTVATSIVPSGIDAGKLKGDPDAALGDLFDGLKKRLFLGSRDAEQFLSGTLGSHGVPQVRVGDKVAVPYGDSGELYTFYVEGTQHSFSFEGTSFLSTLYVSRGAKESDRRTWADAASSYYDSGSKRLSAIFREGAYTEKETPAAPSSTGIAPAPLDAADFTVTENAVKNYKSIVEANMKTKYGLVNVGDVLATLCMEATAYMDNLNGLTTPILGDGGNAHGLMQMHQSAVQDAVTALNIYGLFPSESQVADEWNLIESNGAQCIRDGSAYLDICFHQALYDGCATKGTIDDDVHKFGVMKYNQGRGQGEQTLLSNSTATAYYSKWAAYRYDLQKRFGV